MYRDLTGHDPEIQPYLDYYGLAAGSDPARTPPPRQPPAPIAPAPKKGERGR